MKTTEDVWTMVTVKLSLQLLVLSMFYTEITDYRLQII